VPTMNDNTTEWNSVLVRGVASPARKPSGQWVRTWLICLAVSPCCAGCQTDTPDTALSQDGLDAMLYADAKVPDPVDVGSGNDILVADSFFQLMSDGARDIAIDAETPSMNLPGRVGIGGLSSPGNVGLAMDRVGLSWDTVRPTYDEGGNLNMDPVLDAIDCLVMPGGGDIDPAIYGEDPHETVSLISPGRAALDFALIRGALDRRMPILGLCLGAQEINVTLGGRLVQDIPSEVSEHLNHRTNHRIQIVPGTMMDGLYSSSTLDVVSRHHQAAEDGDGLGAGLRVAARSADGVVEAIEAADQDVYPFLFGTQYHPESQLDSEVHDGLWRAFAEACAAYRAAHPGRVGLPEQDEYNQPCQSDVGPGVCLETQACAAGDGISSSGFCPGPADIQCCAELRCTTDGGHGGQCYATALCDQRGGIPESGSCPGNEDVQCCLEDIDCQLGDGTEGRCLQTQACDAMGGQREAGHCPGPAAIQCCVAP